METDDRKMVKNPLNIRIIPYNDCPTLNMTIINTWFLLVRSYWLMLSNAFINSIPNISEQTFLCKTFSKYKIHNYSNRGDNATA